MGGSHFILHILYRNNNIGVEIMQILYIVLVVMGIFIIVEAYLIVIAFRRINNLTFIIQQLYNSMIYCNENISINNQLSQKIAEVIIAHKLIKPEGVTIN